MNTALFQGKYRIKSNRLPDYDFSSEGAYFVTICTKNRENYFGEIIDSEMIFSEMGIVAKKCRSEILNQFPNTFLDEFVIMPNHIHGIVFLNYGDAVNYDVIYRDAIYRDAINRVSMNMIG
ncbi:MAG TPA: hypothetical protein PKD96_03220, partial [Candidatus Absconditabacterales bacterium]|nr:hypothetical protein [Candidatus Absconditabacterales bacterium]